MLKMRGLSIETDSPSEVVLGRHGLAVRLDMASLLPWTDADASWVFFGLRLGLDQIAWARGDGRPSPPPKRAAGVVRYQEVPSIYGDRLMRLIPTVSRRWAEAVSQSILYKDPWILDGLETLYILETGRILHALSRDEAPKAKADREKLWRDARAALFYDSYKIRPRIAVQQPGYSLRVYETVEGLAASRAIILPEFDYDSAREGGYFSIPSQDCLIIARQESPGEPAALLADLEVQTLDAYHKALHPLTTALFSFDTGGTAFRTWAGGRPNPMGAIEPPEDLEVVQV